MKDKILELLKSFEVPCENLNDGLRNMAIEKHNFEHIASNTMIICLRECWNKWQELEDDSDFAAWLFKQLH